MILFDPCNYNNWNQFQTLVKIFSIKRCELQNYAVIYILVVCGIAWDGMVWKILLTYSASCWIWIMISPLSLRDCGMRTLFRYFWWEYIYPYLILLVTSFYHGVNFCYDICLNRWRIVFFTWMIQSPPINSCKPLVIQIQLFSISWTWNTCFYWLNLAIIFKFIASVMRVTNNLFCFFNFR